MDLGLKDKVALVAAASKGLGYGVARALAREGAKVSICGRDEAAINAAAARLAAETGADVIGTACDVWQPGNIQAWIDITVGKWGIVDALLVNGGGPPAGNFIEFTDEQWQSAFNQLIMTAVRLIRATIPHMKNGSAILTITGSTIVEPVPRLILSTVMRSGVGAMVKALADELAPNGIRINNLLPGRFDTDRVRQLDEGNAAKSGTTFEEARAKSLVAIPFKRLGTIDEFGAAGAFLLSPAAAYITGAMLRVDGGMMRSI